MGQDIAQVMLGSALGVVVLLLGVWLVSLARNDASIVDIAWGLGFVVIAWIAFALGDGNTSHRALLTAMATAWGLRLAVHLFRRNWGRGEDFRYRAMRRANPDHFGRWTLVHVYALQGVLMYVVSLPLQLGQVQGGPDGLVVMDFIGLGVWAIGFAFEATGDWQLRQFKANPANQGKLMDRGLWRYTRHPNYFGDCVAWWGHFLVAAARPEMLWTAIGPLLMTVLLTRVSGVPMLERSLGRRKEGYAEYIARTSAFIPMPRRKA